jgi:hypothetical protein
LWWLNSFLAGAEHVNLSNRSGVNVRLSQTAETNMETGENFSGSSVIRIVKKKITFPAACISPNVAKMRTPLVSPLGRSAGAE